MPARLAATGAYVIVDRRSLRVVSRYPSLADARAAWRWKAFPEPGLIKNTLGTWAAHHLIMTPGAVETALRRRAAEAAKRARHA